MLNWSSKHSFTVVYCSSEQAVLKWEGEQTQMLPQKVTAGAFLPMSVVDY